MGRRGEHVHHTVRRIDACMVTLTRMLARWGAPRAVSHELRGVKKSVGDVIAHLEMIERRSED
jgi:hypothetical protein